MARSRISVVEDDASMRRAVGRLVKAAGYDSAEFESAEALLKSDPFRAPDCLIADIHLPGVDGFQLADKLRERFPKLPVIIITGHDRPELRLEARKRLRTIYLAKPFEGTELLEALRTILIFS